MDEYEGFCRDSHMAFNRLDYGDGYSSGGYDPSLYHAWGRLGNGSGSGLGGCILTGRGGR